MFCGNCENGEFCKCIDCNYNADCGASCAVCKIDLEREEERLNVLRYGAPAPVLVVEDK